MLKRILISFLMLLSLLLSLRGQQPRSNPSPEPQKAPTTQPPPIDSQDVVRITTNLVQVDVAVTKDGKPVTDLRAEDFEIFQDGKPQTITNFSYVSNVPAGAPANVVSVSKSKDNNTSIVPPARINLNDQRRTVALVIDDLGISFGSMSQLRGQVKKFLDQLSPNDLVAIIRTGGDVGSLQQFTNDKRLLQSALDQMRWNPCSRAGLHVFQPAGSLGSNTSLCSGHVMNGTLRALKFILRGMSDLPGRKSMVVFSDYLPIEDQEMMSFDELGDRAPRPGSGADPQIPNSSNTYNYYAQLQLVAELAIRSSVVIYGVDTRGLQYTGLTAADRLTGNARAMQQQISSIMSARSAQLLRGREGSDLIARQSGGFLIRNSNDFGLKRIMEDQQGYYLIGFRPAEDTFNRDFHKITAKVKRGGLTVRTRAGFYGFTDEQARTTQLSAADQMNKALMSPFGASEVTVRLTSFFYDDPGKGPLVRSFLHLDPRELTFKDEADGWHATYLNIKAVFFGNNGRVMGEQEQTGRLRFRGAEYERAMREGVTYGFDLPMKLRGAYQFRVAVRDTVTSRVGAAGQFVEIPDLRSGRLALSGIVAKDESISSDTTTPDRQSDASAHGPSLRRFNPGATVTFASVVYNAIIDGSAAQLTTQTRIFRDGKLVFSGNETPLNYQGQIDQRRIVQATRVQLGAEFPPGEYVFQIIVKDSSDKQKPRVATQWVDFEVVR